jgi:hypothetical protein
MFDSDDTTIIAGPHCAGARVATYADLLTPQLASALLGRLAVIDRGHGDPLNMAHIADIEPGLLTVAEGAAKVRQWHAEGRPFPTAYCNRNDWPAVTAALTGVPHSTWIATLDGTLLPDGQRPDIVQAFGEAAVGFHADMSIVWNDGWHPVRPFVDWTRQRELVTGLANMVNIAKSLA